MIIDINVRTNRFSGESRISPQEAVQISRQKGLDGIILIEKNRLWPEEDLRSLKEECNCSDFIILRGQEIKSPKGRLLVFGCDQEIPDSTEYYEILKQIHSCGGCVVLIHPFPEKSQAGQISEDFITYQDCIEIYNCNLLKKELRRGLDNYRTYNFCAIAGSEAYDISNIGTFATKFLIPVKTERDVVKAMRTQKVRPCVIDGDDVDPRGGSRSAIEWNIPGSHLMKCEGLLFDLYGTIVNLESLESMEEFSKMARWLQIEGINVSGNGLWDFYKRRTSELYHFARDRVSFPDVDILRVFREAIHHFSGEDRGEEFARRAALVFRSLTIQDIKLYPHARKVLRELKRRGYRMGIVTNGQAAFTRPEIEDLKIEKFFDLVIISSDVGYSKPEHRIIQIATTQLEIAPSRSAMIGDDLHGDIYAAKTAGLKTVFVNSNVDTAPYPVAPDVSLTNGDLRNLLRIFP